MTARQLEEGTLRDVVQLVEVILVRRVPVREAGLQEGCWELRRYGARSVGGGGWVHGGLRTAGYVAHGGQVRLLVTERGLIMLAGVGMEDGLGWSVYGEGETIE